jgi:hypothetical protein
VPSDACESFSTRPSKLFSRIGLIDLRAKVGLAHQHPVSCRGPADGKAPPSIMINLPKSHPISGLGNQGGLTTEILAEMAP